ncbi:hypothetical protein BGZ96_006749 [Linnemannia gamsii]|uniref:Cep57 centrosome microtubule-binding domain-containing protein n=1 Tax=Linnemannia gamsii TaxID=64522 RepID=A0ABQ7KE14_9FUNG|nr:hypothetical protein BGZ96_006749 [Linnemannia gamsii]
MTSVPFNTIQLNKAMDWNSSQEDDERTASEDYNMHGASGRSIDHPSATQDGLRHMHVLDQIEYDDDEGSIDNADLDLIADIVDGKPPRQDTYQRRGGVRRVAHQTDENSISSLMRYVAEGSQDPLDMQESPVFDPTRPHTGSHHDQVLLGDDANEDHFRDWSGSTPKHQTRHVSENIKIPKASPFAKRSLLPTRQSYEHTPRQVARPTRGVSIDEGFKTTTLPVSSIPMRAKAGGSGAGHGSPPVTFATKVTTRPIDRGQIEQQPKSIFRSAMKPLSGSLGASSQAPRKLGRHIQLPTELSDDEDEEEEMGESDHDQDDDEVGGKDIQPAPTVVNKTQDLPEAADIALEAVTMPASLPGPTRFTRISKPNVSSASPGKKPIATIPTPQDTPPDDENEMAQKSVKELKAILRKLGLLPLSITLDAALENLDGATVKRGGLCEMMELVQKLGAMCEKQKEVIHQMTDQIIAGESRTQQLQPVVDPEAEEKLQEVHRQLSISQNELEKSRRANRELELEVDYLRQVAEEDRNKEAGPITSRVNNNLVDASSQVSGSWATAGAAALLVSPKTKTRKVDDLTSKPTRSSSKAEEPSPPSSAAWRQHIQKIEQELAALKSVLLEQRHSPINNDAIKGKAEAEAEESLLLQVEDLEDQLYDALLENRRLQVKIKTLARQLLSSNHDHAENHKTQSTKQETTMVKDILLRLGVETPQQVMKALDEVERALQDVPRQRRFIAKAERIIWESEIQDGTVRVQRHSQSASNDDDLMKQKRQQHPGDVTLVMEGSELTIKPGRTCSEGYEATLQRLREWSELLDVLNHVKFVDDFDDNATVLA